MGAPLFVVGAIAKGGLPSASGAGEWVCLLHPRLRLARLLWGG